MTKSKRRNGVLCAAYLTLAGTHSTAALSPASKSTAKQPKTSNSKKKKESKYFLNKKVDEEAHSMPVARTSSFSAMWAGKLDSLPAVEPHTLILGTHPSTTSLEQQQYYAHPVNAFWWIAGDCLGFRRDTGISPSSGKPYVLASALRYDNVLSYEEQMEILLTHGFSLWDVVHSCERKGSLDQNIRNEVVNPIREFCDEHPSIRRIVLANGSSTAALFKKYFKDWLSSGVFQVGDDEYSQKMFGKMVSRKPGLKQLEPRIAIISAISVSPAAAKFTYEEKRDYWEANVYQPGLADLRR